MPGYQSQYEKNVLQLGISAPASRWECRIADSSSRTPTRNHCSGALRDDYLCAGRERRFNHVFNRLLPPQEWFIDQGQLVFMEVNQSVVFWGIALEAEMIDDPPIFQGRARQVDRLAPAGRELFDIFEGHDSLAPSFWRCALQLGHLACSVEDSNSTGP